MNILPFRGLLPDLSLIPEQQYFFDTVKKKFCVYQKNDHFLPPSPPSLFIFRVQRPDLTATGLICTTKLEDYLEGKVLKHEKTIRSKEQVQLKLIREHRAAVKPALLVHRRVPQIRAWLNRFADTHPPLQTVSFEENEQHLLWQVTETEHIRSLQELYGELERVAIADGHHRFASFARLHQQSEHKSDSPFAAIMTAYFPEDQLQIEAFHRLIELPDPAEQQKLLEQLAHLGKLEKLQKPALPQQKHQMCLATPHAWYRFDWKPELLVARRPDQPLLDVDLLQQHILVPLLRVKNIRTDRRIHYLEGKGNATEMARKLRQLPAGCCFFLYPIDSGDFLQVARVPGLTLVPKATFFQPRLKNGLLVQTLEFQ
jgi:uncharacterized protein (DUF1015 family)